MGTRKRHESGTPKKSVVIWTKDRRSHEFKLAGHTLKKVREAKYLGVTITEDGVSDSKTVERIKKGKNVLGVLRRLGVFLNGVHPARAIRLYKSLIQSRWEYGIHLTPWTKKIEEKIKKVEGMFFGQIL